MPDSRKNLYDALSNDFDLGTFEEFNSKMDIPESRKKLYESVSVDFDLGTFDEFEAKVGTLKKKEPTYPGLKDAFGISSRGPLMEKSNLQVTTKKEKQPLKSDLKAEELKSIETNLAKENIELSQIKQKLTALEKSGKLQDPTIQAEYNGLVGQYNEKQKAAKGQFDKYHKEHGNYRTIVRDEQNADLKKGINTAKGVLNKINTYDATLKQVGLRYGQTKVALEEAMQAGDNEAAAQLQGQLKKDEAIIANLGELIKTGKKVAEGQEQSSIGNILSIGMETAQGMLMAGVKSVDESLNAINRDVWGMFGIVPSTQFEAEYKGFLERNKDKIIEPSDILKEQGKIILKEAGERSEKRKINLKYKGLAWEALKDGDIESFAKYGASNFAESLPTSLLYSVSPITASLASGSQVQEEINKSVDETGKYDTKIVLAGGIKAGLEYWTENWLGTGKATKELIQRFGEDEAVRIVRLATEQAVKEGLKKKLGRNFVEEPVGEGLNRFLSNVTDKYVLGKDVELFDGVPEDAITGLFGASTQGVGMTTVSHYIDKARIKEAEDLKSQAANYMEQALLQQNPAAAEVLEEKANTLNLEAQNIVDKEQEIALNANPETMDAIIALEGVKEQLEEALQEEGLPEEVSAVIEEKLSTLQVEYNELIVQATKEAQENIKAEEEEISEPIDVTEFLKGDTKEEDLTRPSVEVNKPELNLSVKENPYKESLKKLGYNDSDIDNMSMEQMQEIVINNTQAPIVESSAKVDSVKENKKQEKLAEMNAELDKEEVKLEEPSSEQQFKEIKEGNTVTFDYASESEVPEIFKDKISSKGELNGKPYVRVTMAKSLAYFYLQSQAATPNEIKEEVKVSEVESSKEEPTKEESSGRIGLGEDVTFKGKRGQADSITFDGRTIKQGEEIELNDVNISQDDSMSDLRSGKYKVRMLSVDANGKTATLTLTDGNEVITTTVKDLRKAEAKEEVKVEETPASESKNFTEAPILNTIFSELKDKYGDKKGSLLYDAAIRLVNPNQNNIIEIRSNGVVVKEGDKYILKPFGNTDANSKKWVLYEGLDITEQFNKQQEDAIKEGNKSESNLGERKGVTEQQQGEQEDRTNKEEPISEAEESPSSRGGSKQSRESKTKEVKSKLTPDEIISSLEKLKVDTKNKSFDAVLGIPVATYNAIIDTIILAVKSGKSIQEAIMETFKIKKFISYKSQELRLHLLSKFEEGVDKIYSDEPNPFKNTLVENIVFHGTKKEFEEFKSGISWFTDSPIFADVFAYQGGRRFVKSKNNSVIKGNFIDIQNPLRVNDVNEMGLSPRQLLENNGIDKKTIDKIINESYNNLISSLKPKQIVSNYDEAGILGFVGENNSPYEYSFVYSYFDSKNFTDALQNNGIDGIIANESGYTTYAVFSPKQVKVEKQNIYDTIDLLENLKVDLKGKLNAFGIAPALWNAGIDTIILAIKANVALADAVQKGIEYFKEKGAEFDEAKVTAFLEEKVGLKRTQPKEEEKEVEEPSPEPKGEKGERKIRRHFLTILNNASLKEATKFMLENDFAYNVKSMERSLSRAKAYLEKNGMEDSYTNFITYGTQIDGLTGDEAIALAFLMQTILNEAVIKEVESGNQEMADELYDEFYRLSEKLGVIGTESGRVVNAFNLFLLDMSNPISAQMALNRIARKAENKAKASDSKERKKAEAKTKAVKSEVDKGKRKTTREVVEFAEDITKEDSELGDIIFKGSKKPISDEMKSKISDFFDNFIPDDEGMLYDGVLGVPLLAWKGFVIGVKKLVIEGGIPLVNAIKQQYDAMVGEYGKETMDKVSAEFQKRSGTTPKEITKKAVEARVAKSKKLNTERFNLEKELQKERDRVAKLRAKEKESQQARIDEQSAKLQLQESKEAQKAIEDKLEKDRTEKQKTLTQAKKEALKNELEAVKQKAKEAQKVLDLADKMALKTIQAELKEAQNKEKQLEKDIDKLGKELVRNRLFEDLVADLVDEYINMKGDTKNEDLIKLVEERLGVKGEKAVKIANKIRSSVYNNVTKRVSDRFERDIETEKKRLYGPEIVEAYEKMTGDEATKDKELLKLIEEKLKLTGEKANQVAKKVKEGTYGKKEPKSGEQIVDELVFAINSKMMTADMMMDLFPSKYGMVNFTAEDFQKVRELSQAIATAPSSERKAIAIKNFLEYLYSFKPYYFAELMNELWYFDVLSGVLTIGLQTGDVNNFYNFVQASAMAKEVPIVSALQSVRRAFEDKKIDYGVSALKDVLTGFTKGLIQTMVRPTANEVKTASAWIKFAFKNKAFLNESRSAFVESFLNGTASFTDFDNPFKNSALGEFDIQRVWDGAKKNKSEGKKGLAYLYWLAMENVYNVGAAAYRFITPFVNKIVPQVGKTLAAQDLFFTGIIKNTYSPFVLREQLRKEGLRGAELEAELAKRLYITEEELASARYTATNWRMKYDIGFSQNDKGEWNIYDNGKAVKKFSLGRLKTMNFATLEEAEDYAKTVVAPSGSRYRLDVISQLNLKRGMEALKAEKRIASFNLLTKASMGYTGTLLSALNSASNWLTKQSEIISESASLKDSRAMRYGLNILATSVLYATHLFSFLKVGTGLARMFSQYYTPIGLARAVRADLQNKSLLGKELDENISKTEIDMLYAKALLGLIPTYFAAGMAQRLAELIKDDEDKDKEEKEVELTAQEKKFLELIEKKNGIKLTNEQKKVLTLVKPGDVVGNLQWMEAGMRRFYTNNKILVESSEFLGYDEQGNRMWSSLSAYPNYILAESIATAAWYMYFNKDNKESNPVTQFVLNPLYKFIDLSIGQGIVKYFASKTSTENKLEALAQTIVFDQLGVFNPNLLSGVMKYVDGKARKNENIFDYIDNQEDGSYTTAIGAYTLDKVVPLKGAWYEATQAPIVYGQFGEEIFRVPAEKQGYISAAIGYYKNKDKNPEQKAMNEFFLSIGINKLYVPDKSPIIDENFKPHKLTPRQRDEYGMLAGRVSFSQFKKLTPLIQEVYSKVSEKAAGDMVNKVFVSNYKNMAALKLGLITQKDFDRLSTENIASVIVKAVKSMNQSVLSEDVLEALEVTKEEKDFMENMKKVSGEDNKRAIFLKQMNQIKDETEISDYLVRMYQLKIMSENMFNNLYNYKILNGSIGANIPERIEEEENQEEEE